MARKRTWQPLATEHKGELVALVVHAHQLASRTPSMRRLAVYLIKLAGWRWTADAVDSATGVVVPDAVKYDIQYLPHTADAASVSAQYPNELSKRLTHEHTIPLALLAEKILGLESGDEEVIYETLSSYCRAAIITREEDHRLNAAKLRSAMPSAWRFGEDMFARYSIAGIELLLPEKKG